MLFKQNIKRMISLILAVAVVIGVGVFRIVRISAEADSNAELYLASGSVSILSTSAYIRLYVGTEKGTDTTVHFWSAKPVDVYGFESTCGGEVMDVKSSDRETSMQATDENGMFVTWTTDASQTPYQAFEADVSEITGPMVLAYEGTEGYHEGWQDIYADFDGYKGKPVNANNCMIMQVYNPRENRYIEVDRKKYINGVVSLSYTVDSQLYAEKGRVRYRITLPQDADSKWIYTSKVTAGQPDKTMEYGTKSFSSSGNKSLQVKGTITSDMLFCAEAVTENAFAYSPIYSFLSETSKQDQLYHFNVNFNGDSHQSRGMTWATTTDMDCYVQVVPYGPLYPDYKNAVTYKGYTEHYTDSNTTKQYSHYVLVDGLEAGHEYWYRYGNGDDIWSTDCYLRIDDGDSDFAFVVMGDPQPEASGYNHNDDERTVYYGGRYKEMMLSWNEAARLAGAELLVCCGDESDAGYWETCWDYYFKSNMPYFRSQTMAVTMGNHDFRYQDSKWNYQWWVRKHHLADPTGMYALKTDVVSGEDYNHGSFYSFDYGNAHFCVINGNICDYNGFGDYFEAELAWIRNDLASTDADFKIVVSHQGMYSYPVHTYDQETKEIRSRLVPILDEYGVDLMFQGHDHVWIRTSSMKGGSKINNSNTMVDILDGKRSLYYIDPDGTTYINSGSATGSKYHEPDPTRFLSLFSVDCASQPQLPTFTTVEISGGKLQVKGWARTKDGSCKRISNYTCYPAGYAQSDGYNILNTSYYDKINNRIKALPEEITLDNMDEVEELKKMCDMESDTVLSRFVEDYGKLQSAVAVIDELKAAARRGDFNDDGQITVTDALAALRISVKLDEETPEMIAIGDINKDGHITVADALTILRVAAKLETL